MFCNSAYLVLLMFDSTRAASVGRAKVTFSAVTGTSVLATILTKMCRFGILFKNMPKTKADCKSLGPLEVFRKLRTACALMLEVLELANDNGHFDLILGDPRT